MHPVEDQWVLVSHYAGQIALLLARREFGHPEEDQVLVSHDTREVCFQREERLGILWKTWFWFHIIPYSFSFSKKRVWVSCGGPGFGFTLYWIALLLARREFGYPVEDQVLVSHCTG